LGIINSLSCYFDEGGLMEFFFNSVAILMGVIGLNDSFCFPKCSTNCEKVDFGS
jgi:hypothetical protein